MSMTIKARFRNNKKDPKQCKIFDISEAVI